MKTKHAFFASVVLAVILSYSCRMPPSIEIRTDNSELGVPLRAELNLTEILQARFQESFVGMHYEMIDHGGVLAFLVAYQMDLLPSFNPSDYLGDITGQLDDYGQSAIDPIDTLIMVPQIAWDTVEPTTFYFGMGEFFETMENSLNRYSMPTTRVEGLIFVPGMPNMPIPLPPGPRFFAFTEGGDANFDSVTVSDSDGFGNRIELGLELSSTSGPLPEGLTVRLTGIQMLGETSQMPIGSPNFPQTAILNHGNNFSDIVTIDLSGARIVVGDPPQFRFGNIEIEYIGTLTAPVFFDMLIRPQVKNIALRGAAGLRIGEMTHPLPDDILDNIRMDATQGFLNAEISRGTLGIRASPPPRAGSNQTYGEGLHISNTIAITQAPVVFDGVVFEGVRVSPWEIGDAPFDLVGEVINASPMEIDHAKSVLFVKSDPVHGMSFELFGDDFHNKTLPIIIDMQMDIEELSLIRWAMDEDLVPLPEIEIHFTDMGDDTDITKFIYSIDFEEVKLSINFTELDAALVGNIALRVKCPELGFLGEYIILKEGLNYITSKPITLDLERSPSLGVDIAMVPVIDGTIKDVGFLELGPLALNPDGETGLELSAIIDIDFNWTQAEIDLRGIMNEYANGMAILDGGYPEHGDAIDLRNTLGDFMRGFNFARDSVSVLVYVDGPGGLIGDLSPMLTIQAESRNRNPTNPDDNDPDNWERDFFPLVENQVITDTDTADFPQLTSPDFSFDALPPGGLQIAGDFTRIIADMPEYLRFVYNIELQRRFTVYPDMFDAYTDNDSAIRAMVIAKIPLDFEIMAGAYFNLPVFEGRGDLFGRAGLDEPLFGGDNLSINSLKLRLDFGYSIFQGAVLHLDGGDPSIVGAENILLGVNGRPLNDGKTGNLEVIIRGTDLDIINSRLIPPNVRIEYLTETRIRIPTDFLPTRISIAASGSYTLDLDERE